MDSLSFLIFLCGPGYFCSESGDGKAISGETDIYPQISGAQRQAERRLAIPQINVVHQCPFASTGPPWGDCNLSQAVALSQKAGQGFMLCVGT